MSRLVLLVAPWVFLFFAGGFLWVLMAAFVTAVVLMLVNLVQGREPQGSCNNQSLILSVFSTG